MRIELSLQKEGYKWIRNMVQYDIDISGEFFIEPKDNYPELFHKRIDLEYQHEVRVLILNTTPGREGISISYRPVSVQSGNFALGELYLEGTAIFKQIE